MSRQNSEILREADLMIKLDHPNIVKLIGIINGNPNRLVLEFFSLGSLKQFLRSNPSFPLNKIMNFMLQVAKGMEYLEKARIVHCDLAAHNVLVVNKENVKISGFGMAREIKEFEGPEYYQTENSGPWWLTSKCIDYSLYNSKSDVWSFGITIWETFSYGSEPYQLFDYGLEEHEDIPRLECPVKCPQSVYDIMVKTWSWRQEDRPSFADLVENLRVIINLDSVPVYSSQDRNTVDNHCKTTQPPEITIDEEEWYFGNIDREEADTKCCNPGDYLVRYSTRQKRYILAVNWNRTVRHILMQEIPDPAHHGHCLYFFAENKGFSTIRDLLDYHVKSQIAIDVGRSSGILLSKAVSRFGSDIKLSRKIAHGDFSDVYEAMIISTNKQVAIKTCRSSVSNDKFQREADILKQCKHPNIVQLFDYEKVYIIIEFMPGGSLIDFLRTKGMSSSKKKLTLMCTQVCAGMKYLEENSFIHFDLAARNCLVGENDIVKISGFGMSHEEETHVCAWPEPPQPQELPIKWTAPEAINYNRYTSASDVWSFGILLWEIFSFGSVPYPGMDKYQAIDKVEAGYRMPPPAACPEPVYNVMLKCWQYNEEERPTFAELYPMLNHVCQMIYD